MDIFCRVYFILFYLFICLVCPDIAHKLMTATYRDTDRKYLIYMNALW